MSVLESAVFYSVAFIIDGRRSLINYGVYIVLSAGLLLVVGSSQGGCI